MRNLSSKWTFFYKKVFPAFWFGMLVVMAAIGFWASSAPGRQAPPPGIFLVIPFIMAAVGGFIMKNLVFDLLDEVWDEGDHLILVKGDIRETVPLSNIINVSETYMANPPRVTLLLREPCRLGREVVFSPVRGFQWNVFKRNPIAQELLQRVHKL